VTLERGDVRAGRSAGDAAGGKPAGTAAPPAEPKVSRDPGWNSPGPRPEGCGQPQPRTQPRAGAGENTPKK